MNVDKMAYDYTRVCLSSRKVSRMWNDLPNPVAGMKETTHARNRCPRMSGIKIGLGAQCPQRQEYNAAKVRIDQALETLKRELVSALYICRPISYTEKAILHRNVCVYLCVDKIICGYGYPFITFATISQFKKNIQ